MQRSPPSIAYGALILHFWCELAVSYESFTMTWDAIVWGKWFGAFVYYEVEPGDHGFFHAMLFKAKFHRDEHYGSACSFLDSHPNIGLTTLFVGKISLGSDF